MGILVITWNFPPRRGGIENVISHFVTGLRQRYPVKVITTHARTQDSDSNNIFRAPCPGLIPFALYAIWRGVRLLRRDREQTVVFGGSALVAPVVLILARLFGRKAVVQTHGLDVVHSNILYQFLCVRWLKHCERIIANSTYTAALARSAGVPEDRVTVIFPGIDAQRFAAAEDVDGVRSKLGFDAKPIILFVGRLARRKGVKEFIENSFVNIARAIPEVCLAIAGDNPLESLAHRDDVLTGIKDSIAHLHLQNHVRLLGAVSDEQVVALYQIADVVVLPALASKEDIEGFGIVLLEAAAAAKPTVATRVGGIPDAIEHGQGGILVAPGDYDELTKALIALLRNDELRKALGRYGSSWVREKFAWPKIIASYERALGLDVGSES
jgi:phosphatidylinositol alpha-1,6-mannosyltransferase